MPFEALLPPAAQKLSFPPPRAGEPPIPYDTEAYRLRNMIERLWCRLKDWRRVATRYDKLAANYLSGALIAASITYWCN